MERLTNTQNIPLAMALWLGVDEYDAGTEENYISATGLLKSVRQIILNGRVKEPQQRVADVADMIKSRIGTALHNSIEQSWTDEILRKGSLQRLGIPQRVQDRIVINPDPAILSPDHIPVYLEQRVTRELNGFLIGGKYDLVTDGIITDTKSTSTWTYMSGSNTWKYRMQGSIYRWLNPDIITKEHMYINFIFLNWAKGEYLAKQEQGYPPHQIMAQRFDLYSLPETELFLRDKLQLLTDLKDAPETELPPCSPDDLWQERPKYKYYKNPSKMTKSTKNFDSHAEAHIRWIQDGQVGVIKEVPGICKFCLRCPAYNICSQKDSLIAQGLIPT